MEKREIVGRFAPTPSGRMHLGNAFSAVMAWLAVRSAGGRMILRIEDLDRQRCKPEYICRLIEDLHWLGLDWDGGYGPDIPPSRWQQSRRSEIYETYFEKLKEKQPVYPCFCSRGQLHAAEAPHASDGTPLYSGECRRLTDRQRQLKMREKEPAWRVAVPDEGIFFEDRNCGRVGENLKEECGDFILRRADGVYAYQLAVTVDDALMGVTQVVRGCDLLHSAPRQIWLQRQWGFPQPEYAHLPLLCQPDGRRLSKREKDLDLGALRQKGVGPGQILGLIGFWAGFLEKPQPISARELVPLFSWEKLQHSPHAAGSREEWKIIVKEQELPF